ncbi:hypothetical protein KI387_003710 [Taxus chinensis]|uniref:Uncharacterized protein n=1 Tax=Taxus chinensis TaxID=29808 RepID=A0AA38GZK4_TAXCH|nr:hypothetical protein KI387_003710 [Taxus chinensis]
MARGKGNGKGKGKGTNKQRRSEPSPTKEIPKDNIETNENTGVTNLQSTNPPVLNADGNERKSTVTANANDERRTFKYDEVTKLKTLNQHLLNKIAKERVEREELKNKLKDCNDEARESHERMTEWNTCKADLESTIAGLQNELNETRMFRNEHEEACTILKQERDELEKKLKEFNDASRELQDKMTEERCRWDTYQENVSGLNDKLETVTEERNMLNHKHEELCTKYSSEKNEFKKSNDENKKLIARMTEDQRLWDSCRQNLEGKVTELEATVAGLQNEVNETRVLREEHENLCTQLRQEKDDMEDKLNAGLKLLQAKMAEDSCLLDTCKASMEGKVAEMQNEFNEIRILSQKHEQLCTELKNEKIELESKLKEYNDESKKLKEKMAKDGHLWDVCKAKLEGTVAGFQTELKEHEELCTQLKQEKVELESKLQEYNEETIELKHKMGEDGLLWDSHKASLEGSIAGLQNKLNDSRMLREEHEELCAQLKQEKVGLENKLKEYNEEIEKLKVKITEDGCFWDFCKANLEGEVAGLKNELIELRMLSERNEALCMQLRQEKIELENKVKEDNDVTKKLQAKMTEDGCLWDNCKANLEGTVAKLENELNETRMLSQKHKELCTQLTQEKVEIETKMKKCYDGIKILLSKSNEKERFWDACKGKLEGTVEVLKNELNEKVKFIQEHEHLCTQLRREKSELEKKLKESNDVTKKLDAKMTEEGRLWNTCKGNLEERIAGLESELDKTKIFSQKHEELCTQLRREKHKLEIKLKELNDRNKRLHAELTEEGCLWDTCKTDLEEKVAGLQSELNKARVLNEKNEELCIQLRNEKNEFENKLIKCYQEHKKLFSKKTEERNLWDACKASLEGTVAGLQNELKETKLKSQKHEELCTVLKKLVAKMTEDGCLWNTCKGNLEERIAGLESELDKTKIFSQKHEELCTQLRREKHKLEIKLKELNDRNKRLHAELTEEGCLWDTCKADLEEKVAGLQSELNKARVLNEKNEELCIQLRNEKNEFENKLIKCYQEHKKLFSKKTEERNLWDACKASLEGTVAGLQNELKETKLKSQKHEELCTVLKKLVAKMTEDGCLWNTCKGNLEERIEGLESELDKIKIFSQKHEELCTRLRREKHELEIKLKELNDRNKRLHAELTEEGCLWDTCKADLEEKVAGLQSELNKARVLNEKNEELCIQLRNEKNEFENKLIKCYQEHKKLFSKKTEERNLWDACKASLEGTVAGLQNELKETKLKRQKHEELCTVLRREKNELQNKLKEYDAGMKELNEKITEDGHLWGTCKAQLEGKVAGLQYERRILSQEHEELCSHLREEKNKLQNKLKECNQGRRKLHAKMTEDCHLWKSCKADLEAKVAELKNELDLMTNEGTILCQKYEELCIECAFLKAQMGDYNDILSSVEDERLGLSSLSENNAKRVEGLKIRLHLITSEGKQLTQKFGEVVTENKSLKEKMEYYIHQHNLAEKERKSLITMSASSDKISREAFLENFNFAIHLESKFTVSKRLATGKNVILPPDELFSGCPYGWCGGIV